jgi:hypothetical protein
MPSRKSGVQKRIYLMMLKICYRLIKFLVTRIYSFTGLISSLPSVLAQIVSIFVLIGLAGSHNSYNIVAAAIFVQTVPVVVVAQLLHICKFFFEIVCSLIINYTELYYFKRSGITHKVFSSFLY